MKIIDRLFPKKYTPSIRPIRQRTKAQVNVEVKKFPKNLGVEHPTNYHTLEKWYRDDPFAHAIIERHVDFILGGGFHIKSKDNRLETLGNQLIRELEFETLLRDYIRRALIIGNGYLEIIKNKQGVPEKFNILDGKSIYVQLKEKNGNYTNEVAAYNQAGDLRFTIVASWKPDEIAHLPINRTDDNPYGVGIIRPLLYTLNQKKNLQNDMLVLMSKKAASKTFVKLGDRAQQILPSEADINSMGQRLEAQHNLSEFVTDANVDISTIDYGSVGDNFTKPLEHINLELIYGGQVPEVLMGRGNIPEGLAEQQMKAWIYRIKSLQENIEKIIEKKVLGPIIQANGFNITDLEFEWGVATPDEKRKDIQGLLPFLGLGVSTSQDFTVQVEKRLRSILGFDEMPKNAETELSEPQPRMPPDRLERPTREPEEPSESISVFESIEEDADRLPLKEYVGFNYIEYMDHIRRFINSTRFNERTFKSFNYIPGTNQEDWTELVKHYDMKSILGEEKLVKLKKVLEQGLLEGSSIRQINKKIAKRVKPGDLEITLPNGRTKRIPERVRTLLMARTETIRASNEGLLDQLESDDVTSAVEWIASIGERTCAYCASQNGVKLLISEARERLPVHSNCRCSFAPIIT